MNPATPEQRQLIGWLGSSTADSVPRNFVSLMEHHHKICGDCEGARQVLLRAIADADDD